MFSSARIWTASRATRAPKIRSTSASHSYVVLRIFNRQNPCYHCSFLYDDARDAIGRHLRFPGTLPPRPTKSVAQALLPVCLCQVDDSTDGVCRPIGSPRFSNRECAIRIHTIIYFTKVMRLVYCDYPATVETVGLGVSQDDSLHCRAVQQTHCDDLRQQNISTQLLG
jgi:hypothetical protein